jgi:hypothetical protein
MALNYITDAGTLTIPMASADIKVATSNSGLSTNGVLLLVGEADAGPRFDAEDNLGDNAFGADEISAIIAKYGSGPLVDACIAAVNPSNDPNIVGAPSRIIPVKTNLSQKAKASLALPGGADYGVSLADKSFGKPGNLINFAVVQKTAEVLPTTGAFTLLVPNTAISAELRVNGGGALPLALTLAELPPAIVSAIDALAGVTASGGANRGVLGAVSGNLTVTVPSGNQIQLAYSGTWATVPSVGDTLYIPTGSAIAGASSHTAGSYVVTAATTNSITATKLLDVNGALGALTAPAAVASTPVAATTDAQVFAPVTVALESGNPLVGAGKALEIAEVTAGGLASLAYALSVTPVTWISKSGSPALLTSASEYAISLNTARAKDNIQESLSVGGEVALKVGYAGTSAQLVINDTTLTVTVVGGTGANFSVDLADFPTISDLATYIGAKTGFKADVGTSILGQLPTTALDNVTVNLGSSWGAEPARLKVDAFRLFNKVVTESALVQLQDANGNVVQAPAGLPQVSSLAFLNGGSKGSTADADVVAALSALEKVQGNFVVPLFSRDATADKADGLTDTASSYTIDGINAAVRSHVLAMSTLKRRKNRQAFLSRKDTFANDKLAAANTASFRCAYPFMDIKNPSSIGTIKQFQPWMGAVNAAALQAAAFYKSIVRKFANISGALQAAGDFNDQDDTQVEEALNAGLLPLRRASTGGWYWVSDQTTYGKDSNFVFNSIQATYVADIIALTTAQRMETAFVGQSVADVSAALALAFLETIMDDFRRLKLIAPSDDAPKGFRNAKIKISGTAMIVSLEVKLAGSIYFIPISFLVSQVTQSA